MIPGADKPTSCFFHVPKTGGSALTLHLHTVLGENEVFHVEAPRPLYVPPPLLLGSFSVVAGHFHMGPIPAAFFQTVFFFTFLREPVDRILSLYYFLRHGDVDHDKPVFELDQGLDLDTVLSLHTPANGSCTTWSNGQTLLFSGAEDNFRPATELLPAALRNLERFDFVGIYEQFAEGVRCLGRMRGWPLEGPLPRFKTSRERPGVGEIDLALRTRILEANRCDEQLYGRARELWARAQASMPGMGSPSGRCRVAFPGPTRGEHGTREVTFSRLEVVDGVTGRNAAIVQGNPVVIHMELYGHVGITNLMVGYSVADCLGIVLYGVNSVTLQRPLSIEAGGTLSLSFQFDQVLAPGGYRLSVYAIDASHRMKNFLHWIDNVTIFWSVPKEPQSFVGLVDLRSTLTLHEASGAPAVGTNASTIELG